MNKPNFKKICLMYMQQLTNFPYIEKDFDAITDYELLCRVVEYLNQVISNTNYQNESITNLYNAFIELKEYVDNLDLQEEVNNKLDEMATDGTLENLLKNIFNLVDGTLTCNIDYRDSNDYIEDITDETTPIKGHLQGFTTTPTTYLIIRKIGGSNETELDTMCYLQEISKSSKQLIREAYLQLYHANSIAYNDETKEIYVTATNYTDAGGFHITNEVIIVDYTSFTIKDSYIPTEITTTNRVRSVSYDNKNKVLAFADELDVFIMEDLTHIKTHIVLNSDFISPQINPTNLSATIQNIVVYDNKIYLCRYNTNAICVFDMEGNLIKNYYSFDLDIPVHMGELESIAIEEKGTIFLASIQKFMGGNTNQCKTYDITIFKSNLLYNGFKNYLWSEILSNRPTFYVDCETTNHLQTGNADTPLKTISQAIMSAEYLDRNISVNIKLVGNNKQYGFITSKTNIALNIYGNNNKVYGIGLENCKLYCENLKVDGNTIVNFAYNNTNKSNIAIYNNSKIHFKNLTLENTENKDYGITVKDSKIFFDTLAISNYTNALYLLENSEIDLSGITFTSCVYNWLITHNTVKINYGTNAYIYNASNLETGLLPKVYITQTINKTFTDNRLTFSTKLDNMDFLHITANINVDSINKNFNLVIGGATNYYTEIYSNSYTYKVYLAVTHPSTGNYDIIPTVIKVDNSTKVETILQSSAYTFNVSNLYVPR